MKIVTKISLIVLLISLLVSCEEDEINVVQTASIKIIHALVNTGDVEIRNLEGSISNRARNPLRYGRNERYTLPANTVIDFLIVEAEDTLNTFLDETLVVRNAGTIYSLFLVGDSSNMESLLIEDVFQNYQDSTFGVRFINLSPDSEPISVRRIANDTINVSSGISYQSTSDFEKFSATSVNGEYNFQFLDTFGNVIASESINPINNGLVGKNITLALIGLFDNGEGENSLSIANRINHFLQ